MKPKTALKASTKKAFNNAVAILMAFVMVFWQTPVYAWADDSASSGASGPAAPALSAQATDDEPSAAQESGAGADASVGAGAASEGAAGASEAASAAAAAGDRAGDRAGDANASADAAADAADDQASASSEGADAGAGDADGAGDAASDQPGATDPAANQGDSQESADAADKPGADASDASESAAAADKDADEGDKDERNGKKKLVYEDNAVKVTVTLAKPDALPAGVTFKATPITPLSRDYNYDAYLQALNDNAAEGVEYTSDNTLLYDFAFLAADDAGKLVEVQPEKGAVKVSVEFKKQQLENILGDHDASDVEIVHLPLKDSVRNSVDTTAEATAITAADVVVDELADSKTSVASDASAAELKLDSFSGVAFSVPDAETAEDGKYKVVIKFVDAEGNAIDSPSAPGSYYLLVQQGDGYYYKESAIDSNETLLIGEFVNKNNQWDSKIAYSQDSTPTVSIVSDYNNNGVINSWEAHDKIKNNQLKTYSAGDKLGNYILKSIDQSTDGVAVITLQEKPKYTVTVNVYDFDKVTPYAKTGITEKTYIRVKATKDGEGYFAVIPINLDDQKSVSVTVDQFLKMNDTEDFDPWNQNKGTTKENGALANSSRATEYDPSFVINQNDVRLITSTEAIKTQETAFSDAASVGSIAGLRFLSNKQNESKTASVVSLRHVETKYDVRLYFEPEGVDIVAGDLYYLFIEVTHQTSVDSYYLAPLVVSTSSLKEDTDGNHYIDITIPNWQNGNGGDTTDSFTGNEANIAVSLLKATSELNMNNATNGSNCVRIAEGAYLKNYVVEYGTRIKEENAAQKAILHIDPIYLTRDTVSNDFDFRSILGPGLGFGITADRFRPAGSDVQSNFAVNYLDPDNTANPNLSGANAGAIAAAYFVDYDDYGIQTGGPYVVSESDRNEKNTLNIDSTHGDANIVFYADSSWRLRDQSRASYIHTVEMTPEDISNTIVEPIISYMKDMSAQLAAHEANVSPQVIGNKCIIDATGYDDGATIYVDADAIPASYLKEADQLLIKKKPNQVIVFNFDSTEQVELGQYAYEIYDGNGNKTASGNTSSSTEQGDKNTKLDSIIRSVVWNLASAKDVRFRTSAGIFLVPNEGSFAKTETTTTGWLITDGFFTTGGGEWHYVYADQQDIDTASIHAYKTVNGVEAASDQKFEFLFEKYSADGNWSEVETVQNNGALVQVDVGGTSSHTLSNGWNVYRITETRVVDAEGAFEENTQVFYAAVRYQSVGTGDNVKMVASATRYFSTFGESQFTAEAASSATTPADVGLSGEVSKATFENSTDVGNLSLAKTLDPRPAETDNTLFEFIVSVQVPNSTGNGTKPLTGIYRATVTQEGQDDVVRNVQFKQGVATVKLAAGQTIVIAGIPAGATYSIVEERTDGYAEKSKSGNEGTIAKNEVAAASFVNTQVGDLQVSKTVVSNVASDSSKKFSFTVTLGNENVNGTYGDMHFANGVATFELSDGDVVTATGLPAGVGYTVTEQADDAFTTTSTGSTGEIGANRAVAAAFVNSRAESGSLAVKKTVVGGSDSDEFNFTVTLGEINGTFGDAKFTNNEAIVTVDKGQKVTVAPVADHIHYKVECASNKSLSGTYGSDDTAMAFTNGVCEYDSTDGTIRFAEDLPANGAPYTFKITLAITGTYGDMAFTNGVATFKLKNGETKSADGLPLGVTYEVTETEANQNGYTTTATGNTGTITGTHSAEFVNTKDQATTSITVSGGKNMTGRALTSSDVFDFKIEATDDNAADAPLPDPATVQNTGGTFTFGAISYSTDCIGKTYTYQVTETTASTELITADSSAKTFVVKITAAENGDPVATIYKDDGETELNEAQLGELLTFTNAYKSKASVTLGGTKVLEGADMTEGQFTFEVKEGDTVVASGTNAAAAAGEAGAIAFSSIEYTQDDLADGNGGYLAEKTHTYTVTEKQDAVKDGISQTGTTSYAVTVKVSIGADGKLKAEPSENSTQLAFTNAYEATGELTLAGNKTIDVRDIKQGETFTFTVSEIADGQENVIQTVTATAEADTGKLAIPYRAISYTLNVREDDTGAHQYVVRETATTAKGVTKSASSYTFTTTVADNGKGQLTVTTSGADPEALDFVNAYEATGTLTLSGVTKQLTGREWGSGETFNFVLSEVDDAGIVIEGKESVTTGSVSAAGKVSFGEISYFQRANRQDVGVHHYKIVESGVDGGGLDRDSTNASDTTFDVTVVDKSDGTLSVDGATDGVLRLAKAYTNAYTANGTAQITATKHINGRSLKPSDACKFTFKLTGPKLPAEGVTATNAADGSVTFPEVGFTNEDLKGDDGHYATSKTFEYTITEVAPTADADKVAGIEEYDGSAQTVKVTMTDNQQGKLSASYEYPEGGAVFTNTYNATGYATLGGTKTITGRTFNDVTDSFTAKIEAVTEGAPMPVESMVTVKPTTGAGSVDYAFGRIDYKLTDIPTNDDSKTFKYKVTEAAYTMPGVDTKDTTEYLVEVTISDKGDGTLNVNTKRTSSASSSSATTTDGTMTGLDFANTYDAKGYATLKGAKSIDGRRFKEGDTATVKIEAVTAGAPLPTRNGATEQTLAVIPTAGETNANYQFGDIEYRLSDIPEGQTRATFEYKVTESAYSMQGVAEKDSTEYKVAVTISDKGDGTLNVVKSDNAEDLDFTNTYDAKGHATLSGAKNIIGRAFKSGDSATMTITAKTNGAPLPKVDDIEQTSVTVNPTAGTSASFAFGQIDYKLADIPSGAESKTFEYEVSETAQSMVGVAAVDSTKYTVSVTISDKGDGTLNVVKSENATALNFTNAYDAVGYATFGGAKNITGRAFKSGDSATMKIEAMTEGAPMPRDGDEVKDTVTVSPTEGTSAAFEFAQIEYHLKDLGGAASKTFEYKVTEYAYTMDGVAKKDSAEYTVTATISDKGDGNLNVALSGNATALNFTNAYDATGSATFAGTKTVTGRAFKSGDTATMKIAAVTAGAPLPKVGDEVRDTVTVSPAEGTSAAFQFAGIEYKLSDIPEGQTEATFTYKVTESDYTMAGVAEKDSTEYTVAVTVSDKGDGTLNVEAKRTANEGDAPATSSDGTMSDLDFTNTYKATGALELTADKVFTGSLAADQFSFAVIQVDENNKPVIDAPTIAKNDADGNVKFEVALSSDDGFEAADDGTPTRTYYFRMYEPRPEQSDGIEYDEAQYLFKVTATDDLKGNIAAAVDSVQMLYPNGDGGYDVIDTLGEKDTPTFYNNQTSIDSFAAMKFKAMSLSAQGVGLYETSVYPVVYKDMSTEQGDSDDNTAAALLAPGEFSFELHEGANATDADSLLAVATNDETGEVAFFDESSQDDWGLVFSQPGTYEYTICETNDGAFGVTYDTATIGMTVVVTEADGALQAQVTYTKNGQTTDRPAFSNTREVTDLKVRKVSRSGGEGLDGCMYALYLHNQGGADVLLQEATSANGGWITFENVALIPGQQYYYKEVEAPAGHTVDPYRTAYFTVQVANGKMSTKVVEETAADGWHSKYESAG